MLVKCESLIVRPQLATAITRSSQQMGVVKTESFVNCDTVIKVDLTRADIIANCTFLIYVFQPTTVCFYCRFGIDVSDSRPGQHTSKRTHTYTLTEFVSFWELCDSIDAIDFNFFSIYSIGRKTWNSMQSNRKWRIADRNQFITVATEWIAALVAAQCKLSIVLISHRKKCLRHSMNNTSYMCSTSSSSSSVHSRREKRAAPKEKQSRTQTMRPTMKANFVHGTKSDEQQRRAWKIYVNKRWWRIFAKNFLLRHRRRNELAAWKLYFLVFFFGFFRFDSKISQRNTCYDGMLSIRFVLGRRMISTVNDIIISCGQKYRKKRKKWIRKQNQLRPCVGVSRCRCVLSISGMELWQRLSGRSQTETNQKLMRFWKEFNRIFSLANVRCLFAVRRRSPRE